MAKNKPTIKEIFDAAKTGQAIAVNATATVYSDVVTFDKHEGFAIFYQASSGGTIGLDITAQASMNGTDFADIGGFPLIHNDLADSDLHPKLLPIPMIPYFRVKVVGIGSNAATTKIRFWLSY